MSEVLLQIDDVHKSYGDRVKNGNGEGLQVLTGASLSVSEGELVALVAPSGAGKSTLLHIAGLLERPDSGDVIIGGLPTNALSDRARTNMRRNALGFVYQFHHLLPEFTALENVAMPQLIAGKSERDAQAYAAELLERLGVGHRLEHHPSQLSGGEQQRVAIARAAANRPHLVLADEPTGNLDPRTSSRVFDELATLLREQNSGVLFVTHDHSLAARADRAITLQDGTIMPAELEHPAE